MAPKKAASTSKTTKGSASPGITRSSPRKPKPSTRKAEADASTATSPSKVTKSKAPTKKVSPAKAKTATKKASPKKGKALEDALAGGDDYIPFENEDEEVEVPKRRVEKSASPAKKSSAARKSSATKRTEVQASPPKQRGRPRKNASEEPAASGEASPPKRRGRPKKDATMSKEREDVMTSLPKKEALKSRLGAKKNGSPGEGFDRAPSPLKKSTAAKTKAGAKKASPKTSSLEEADEDAVVEAPAKSRGRSGRATSPARKQSPRDRSQSRGRPGRPRSPTKASPAKSPARKALPAKIQNLTVGSCWKFLGLPAKKQMSVRDNEILEVFYTRIDEGELDFDEMKQALGVIGRARGSEALVAEAEKTEVGRKKSGSSVPTGLARSPSKSPGPKRTGGSRAPLPAKSLGAAKRGKSPTAAHPDEWTDNLSKKQRQGSGAASAASDRNFSVGDVRPSIEAGARRQETQSPERATAQKRQSPVRKGTASPSRQGSPAKGTIAGRQKSKSKSPARDTTVNRQSKSPERRRQGASADKQNSYGDLSAGKIPALPPAQNASRTRKSPSPAGRGRKSASPARRQASPGEVLLIDRRIKAKGPISSDRQDLEDALNVVATADEQRLGDRDTVRLPAAYQKKPKSMMRWKSPPGSRKGSRGDDDDDDEDDDYDDTGSDELGKFQSLHSCKFVLTFCLARDERLPSRSGSQSSRSTTKSRSPSKSRQGSMDRRTQTASRSPTRSPSGSPVAPSSRKSLNTGTRVPPNSRSTSGAQPPQKFLQEGQPSAKDRGHVQSCTNPLIIEGDAHGKLNPFFETMPAPETWHRRMPPYFPFGETPYMEKVLSDQITRDLANSEWQSRPCHLKNAGPLTGNCSA